jgi:cytochrome c5
MKRLFLVLLMLVLPLQFTWAMAASYCGHETEVKVSHPGHHDHMHDHQHEPVADKDVPDDGQAEVDSDCHVCHGHGTPALMVAPSVPAHTVAPPVSPDGSDRFADRFVETPHRPPLHSLA